MSCQVCAEDFNKTKRKPITCPKCNEVFCTECVKRYVADAEFACMSCKCVWSYEFMVANLTKSFMKSGYKELQAAKLFEKEIALLPDTMYYIELMREEEELYRRKDELYQEIQNLTNTIRDIDNQIASNRSEIYGKSKRKRYIPETNGPCPAGDCRGFICKRNNICSVCDTKICKDCREIVKESEHECKPENIESANLIKRDSKPCPKCAVFIFKIDGCDQMWCSNCHTAFSWTTGEIEQGRVHNPHYYTWLRENTEGAIPREREDANCNDVLVEWFMFHDKPEVFYNKRLEGIHRQVVHVRGIHIRQLQQTIRENEDNKRLRINYILKEIDADHFKAQIEKKQSILRRSKAILDCLSVYYDVMVDIFQRLRMSFLRIDETFAECERIINFTNKTMAELEVVHSCSFKKYNIPL